MSRANVVLPTPPGPVSRTAWGRPAPSIARIAPTATGCPRVRRPSMFGVSGRTRPSCAWFGASALPSPPARLARPVPWPSVSFGALVQPRPRVRHQQAPAQPPPACGWLDAWVPLLLRRPQGQRSELWRPACASLDAWGQGRPVPASQRSLSRRRLGRPGLRAVGDCRSGLEASPRVPAAPHSMARRRYRRVAPHVRSDDRRGSDPAHDCRRAGEARRCAGEARRSVTSHPTARSAQIALCRSAPGPRLRSSRFARP